MILPVSKTTEINPLIPTESADTSFQKKHNANQFVSEAERAFKAEMNRQNQKGSKEGSREQQEEQTDTEPEIFAILTDRDFRQLLLAFDFFGSRDIQELIRNIRQIIRRSPFFQTAGMIKSVGGGVNASEATIKIIMSQYSRNIAFHEFRPGSGITAQI